MRGWAYYLMLGILGFATGYFAGEAYYWAWGWLNG